MREDAHRPFDLAKGPLLRLSLLRLGEREHVLLVTLHHIIADGWSAGVLVRELGELYGSFRTGRPPALTEPSLQYADFATWQRATLQGEEMEAQRSWWSRQLADVPESLELPTDRPRRTATGTAGMRKVLLPPALVEGLEALARQESGTLFMAVLAGLKVLLSRYSGQDDFLIGSPFANRGQAGTEGVVGLFFEPLVFAPIWPAIPPSASCSRAPATRCWRACPSGRALRVAGGAAAQPPRPLPGALQPERRSSFATGAAGPAGAGAGDGARHHGVGPHRDARPRARRGVAGGALQRGPLRGLHPGAPAGTPAGAAGGRRRRPSRT